MTMKDSYKHKIAAILQVEVEIITPKFLRDNRLSSGNHKATSLLFWKEGLDTLVNSLGHNQAYSGDFGIKEATEASHQQRFLLSELRSRARELH